jgi:hypothetical protein
MRILVVTAITALLCIGLLATTVFPVVAQEAPGTDKSGETVVPVVVQEAPGPDQSGDHVKGYCDWRFSFELGGWVPAFQGNVTAKGRTSDVKVTLIDELQSLDDIQSAIGSRFEVSKGPWGFLFDEFYVRASQSISAQKKIKIPILDPPEFTIQGSGNVTGAYAVGEAALSYDVYASPCLVANMPELTVAVLGGAHDTYLRTIVGLAVRGPLGATRTFSSDKPLDWVDPFVGWRVSWRPCEKWLTSLTTEYGGFTVASDFLFNISLEATYKINKCLYVNFGLSALYDDYETGSGNDRFEYNVWSYGPFVGVGLDF